MLQQPLVNQDPADQHAAAGAYMRNGWNAGDLSGENVQQVRPRNAKVIGGGLDVHDFSIVERLISSAHRAILRLKVLAFSSIVRTSPGQLSPLRQRMIMCTTTAKSFQMMLAFIRRFLEIEALTHSNEALTHSNDSSPVLDLLPPRLSLRLTSGAISAITGHGQISGSSCH
jgi:hypothetical protein